MTEHVRFPDVHGIAALGICEALLLALTDANIISEKDARDVLTDVATTHQEAADASHTPDGLGARGYTRAATKTIASAVAGPC